MNNDILKHDPVLIPHERLSREALEGLVDEYVTREGTDYGHSNHSLEDKRKSVLRQIESGDVLVVFDPGEETCNLIRATDLPRAARTDVL